MHVHVDSKLLPRSPPLFPTLPHSAWGVGESGEQRGRSGKSGGRGMGKKDRMFNSYGSVGYCVSVTHFPPGTGM